MTSSNLIVKHTDNLGSKDSAEKHELPRLKKHSYKFTHYEFEDGEIRGSLTYSSPRKSSPKPQRETRWQEELPRGDFA
jgi:hypothetical protein